MTTHKLLPGRDTIHGHFSPELRPALEVDVGDTILARTPASWDNLGFARSPLDLGHALMGPIFVRGAEPGDALAVEILRLRPAPSGITLAGDVRSPVNDRLALTGAGRHRVDWEIDPERSRARAFGFEIDLGPFLGVIGMPPSERGVHSTIPPRPTGGNMDCRDLVVGTTLVLPVAVKGGLLSFGDGHAAQGDGEVAGTALECAMDEVEIRINLIKAAGLRTPEAYTTAGFITFGFATNLDEAMLIALEAMIDRLQSEFQLERANVTVLASVAVDLHVTQVVNKMVGVHAVLPTNRLRRRGQAVAIRKR